MAFDFNFHVVGRLRTFSLRLFVSIGKILRTVFLQKALGELLADYAATRLGSRSKRKNPYDLLEPSMAQFPKTADGFHPAEDFLDAFAKVDAVAIVACCESIDGRTFGLLGNVWGDSDFP